VRSARKVVQNCKARIVARRGRTRNGDCQTAELAGCEAFSGGVLRASSCVAITLSAQLMACASTQGRALHSNTSQELRAGPSGGQKCIKKVWGSRASAAMCSHQACALPCSTLKYEASPTGVADLVGASQQLVWYQQTYRVLGQLGLLAHS